VTIFRFGFSATSFSTTSFSNHHIYVSLYNTSLVSSYVHFQSRKLHGLRLQFRSPPSWCHCTAFAPNFSVCVLDVYLLCCVMVFCRKSHQRRREHWYYQREGTLCH
jgi:hypothetical protein